MPVALRRSLLSKHDEYVILAPKTKRFTSDDEGLVLSTIIIPVVVIFVLAPLFIFMYKAWHWERVNGRNGKRVEVKGGENGQFEKAELSSGSSVIISEMNSAVEAQELPERKSGLPHEMAGATAFPQELPGDLLEMPANVYKKV